MFNEHDLHQIHGCMENPFPRIRLESITTTMNRTKMNNIVPIIPEPTRSIMDLTLLLTGANLNALLGLVIALNSSMYTSANCYIMSLVCSNLAILFEPLQRVLQILYINLKMNLDYIFLVTFDASILSITIFNIETYVIMCQKNSSLRTSLLKISTAVKGTLLIWIMCIMLTAMELCMYDHFEEETIYDICVLFTIMFLIFPCIIFIMLDYFILYNLIISKSISGTWLSEDIERFLLLGKRRFNFYLNKRAL